MVVGNELHSGIAPAAVVGSHWVAMAPASRGGIVWIPQGWRPTDRLEIAPNRLTIEEEFAENRFAGIEQKEWMQC